MPMRNRAALKCVVLQIARLVNRVVPPAFWSFIACGDMWSLKVLNLAGLTVFETDL